MGLIKNMLRYGFGRAIGSEKTGNAFLAYGVVKDAYKNEKKEIDRQNYENLKITRKKVEADLLADLPDYKYLSETQKKIFAFNAKMISKDLNYNTKDKTSKNIDDWYMEVTYVNYVNQITIQFMDQIEGFDDVTDEVKEKSKEYSDKITKTVFIFESKKLFLKFLEFMKENDIKISDELKDEILKNMESILNSK